MLANDDFYIDTKVPAKAQHFDYLTAKGAGAFGKLSDLHIDDGVWWRIHLITLTNDDLLSDLCIIRDDDVIRSPFS